MSAVVRMEIMPFRTVILFLVEDFSFPINFIKRANERLNSNRGFCENKVNQSMMTLAQLLGTRSNGSHVSHRCQFSGTHRTMISKKDAFRFAALFMPFLLFNTTCGGVASTI